MSETITSPENTITKQAKPANGTPGGSANVTAEEVVRVAELANLELTAEELPAIERDLNAILGYIAQLNELDTTGVTPMAQVGELLAALAAPTSEADQSPPGIHGRTLRADQVRPSLDRSQVLAAAPETDGAFFKVPKVIER